MTPFERENSFFKFAMQSKLVEQRPEAGTA